MRPPPHRRATWLACLLTLLSALVSPLLASGAALCVSRSHLALEPTMRPDLLDAVAPGCHEAATTEHGPCTDVELSRSLDPTREVTSRTDAAPPLGSAPALPAGGSPPLLAAAPATAPDGPRAPSALTFLDLRVLRI